MENSGAWMVGIRWHSVAVGDRRGMSRLPLLVPLMVQLLAVDADMPLAVGHSSSSGVEAFARLLVHPVSATMVSHALLSAWNGLSAGSALVGLREGVKQWCVVDVGSLNVTSCFFFFPQRRQLGMR